MNAQITTGIIAIAAAMVSSCNATGEERAYDTSRSVPAMTPAPSAPADSTTGVARSSGRPGVAGDTVSRSSEISAPKAKTP